MKLTFKELLKHHLNDTLSMLTSGVINRYEVRDMLIEFLREHNRYESIAICAEHEAAYPSDEECPACAEQIALAKELNPE